MTEPGAGQVAETDESVKAAVVRPADGLKLLGEYQGSGFTEPRFIVRRADGQVIQLSRLLYLVTSAITAGAADGGWTADQVARLAGTEFGRDLTADNIRYLVAGKLIPLRVVVTSPAGQLPDAVAVAAPAPRSDLLLGLKIRGVLLPPRAAGAIGRGLAWLHYLAFLLLRIVGRGLQRLVPGRRPGGAVTVAATSVLSFAAAVAVTAAVITAGRATAPVSRGTGAVGGTGPSAGTAAQAAAVPAQAAAWVAREVRPNVAVSCDPAMCRLLQQDGFPADKLKPLPVTAPDLLGSSVVVATSVIRSQFGTRLAASYAPQVIAGFGSGTARVDVRTVATGGAARFQAQLAAEHAAQATAGQQLLDNKNITPSPAARAALKAGRVDSRLLAILSALSHQLPVQVVSFSGGPGADASVPLGSAEVTAATADGQSAILSLLRAQQGSYRPAAATAANTAGSAPAVTLRFDAPAPAGVLQS